MKKVKALVPLIATLALLASCGGGESTGGESTGGESTGGESSEEPVSELAAALEELSIGYDIDISIDETYYGIALNDEGLTVGLADYGTFYFVPEEVADEATGTSETYVAGAWLNLANEVETEVSDDTWASMWTNVWSLLSEEDFTQLSSGVYSAHIESDSEVATYAAYQFSLGYVPASAVEEINLTMEEGEVVQIELVAGNVSITATVNALGEEVETGIAPATGDSISAIDDMMTALENKDYMMTEEYAFLDASTGEYVVNDYLTYSVYVDDGVYAYDGDINGYIQLDSGVELVGLIGNEWYYGAIFDGYTLAEMLYLIDDWQISSVLFEETDTEGTYALRDDVPGVLADMGYFDAYMNKSYATAYATDLTITVGTDSIVFTAMVGNDVQYIVSYTDIGLTDISSVLNSNSNVSISTLGDYYDQIVSSAFNYDFATVLGTDDQALWYAAFSHVYLPLYGLGDVTSTYASYDPFTDSSEISNTSYSISLIYDAAACDYFETYLYMHGYSLTTVAIDGYTYSVYTYTFEYTPTDEEGNAGETETHTVSVYQSHPTYSESLSSGYGYIYNVKIDLNLSAYTSAD